MPAKKTKLAKATVGEGTRCNNKHGAWTLLPLEYGKSKLLLYLWDDGRTECLPVSDWVTMYESGNFKDSPNTEKTIAVLEEMKWLTKEAISKMRSKRTTATANNALSVLGQVRSALAVSVEVKDPAVSKAVYEVLAEFLPKVKPSEEED